MKLVNILRQMDRALPVEQVAMLLSMSKRTIYGTCSLKAE